MTSKTQTPVEALGKKYPAFRNQIVHTSTKWAKRTNKLKTPWPIEGTWCVERCEDLKSIIKNYRPRDDSKKRQEKREAELDLLAMFEKEGKEKRRLYKEIKDQKKLDPSTLKQDITDPNVPQGTAPPSPVPPPYKKEQGGAGLYPVITGTVNFEGEIQTEEVTKEEREKQKKEKQQAEEAELAETEKKLDQANQAKQELEKELETIKILKWAKEAMSREKDSRLDSEDEGSQKSGLKGKDQQKKDEGIMKGGWKFPKIKVISDEDTGDSNEEGLRERRSGRKKRSIVRFPGKDSKSQCPIIIKGGNLQYIPWAGRDLPNLIDDLPNIMDGAGRWIRQLEAGMMGKKMALGDLKALITKVLGMDKMIETLRAAGIPEAAHDPDVDGAPMDQYRGEIWRALRNMYPNRVGIKTLRGEPLGDEENPAAYVERQLTNWRVNTERNILEDPIMNSMFRAAVLDGLPAPVKAKLEEKVGLDSRNYLEFVDQVVHAVERYRKEEKNADKQIKEVQRKLAQAQLEELKKKEKTKEEPPTKKMAPIMTDLEIEKTRTPEAEKGVEGAQAVITYHISGCNLSGNPLGSVPNFQNWTPQNQNNRGPGNGKPPYPGQRGLGQGNNQGQRANFPFVPNVPGTCWGCGETGHIKRNCPQNSQRQGGYKLRNPQ